MTPPALPPVSRVDHLGLGIACNLGAVFCFAIVDGLAKWLGQDYSPIQILFFRYLFGVLPVAVILWRSGGLASLRTDRLRMHLLRASLLFTALYLFFEALRGLPLAEAIAVAFTAPLFVTAMAGPLLGERVDGRRWAAVIVGFLGALIMVRPGSDAFQPASLLVLGSAFTFSLLIMLTRHMTRSETSVALLSYTTLFAGCFSLALVAPVWRTPVPADLWLFVLLGIVGGIAGYLVILAYRNAPVSLLAPLDYTALLWGALLGWVVWREQPDPPLWIGGALVLLAGLYIARREARLARQAPATVTRPPG